jgi:RND family efflux transporter MFP subunit
MKRKTVMVVVLLMAGSFGLGRWRDRPVTASAPSTPPGVLYYHDPMHPSYRSDRPGSAPDCGMKLVPVYAKGADPEPAEAGVPGEKERGVRITPEKQQLIGVRLGEAEVASNSSVFRTAGRIVADEARVYRLTAKVDGWVRKIYPDSTGTLVKKGQPLLAIYSKDLQVAQQAYVFALKQLDRFHSGDEPDGLDRLKQAASDALVNLQNVGMSQQQIEEVARTRTVRQEVDLVAPASGFITNRSVYADQRFDRGMDFYRIVDLNRVWILADISEPQVHYIGAGTSARVSSPQIPAVPLEARVGNVLPQFDATSRTLQVRLEAENPGFALKPDMYVDLDFALRTPPGIVVPRDAVIDSGLRKTVFVARGSGYFEARSVRTGWRMGDRVEIVDGLEAGERIVVSGNFLIDSESRMQSDLGRR